MSMFCCICGRDCREEPHLDKYDYFDWSNSLRAAKGNNDHYFFCWLCGKNYYSKFAWHLRRFVQKKRGSSLKLDDLYNNSLGCQRCHKLNDLVCSNFGNVSGKPLNHCSLPGYPSLLLCDECISDFKIHADIVISKFKRNKICRIDMNPTKYG